MYQIEVYSKSTSFFASTEKYELYGPDINMFHYTNIHGGVGTIELLAGDHVVIYDADGTESVNYVVGD